MSQFLTPRTTPMLPAPGAPPLMAGARGFVVHNDFSAASSMPTINARGFVAEAASMGAIGEGIGNVGQQIDRVEQIRLHAFNERKIAEADSILTARQADLTAELAKENDTGKWQAKAAAHNVETEKLLLTNDLSPDARDAITNRFVRYASHTEGNAKVMAANREIQLVGDTYKAQIVENERNGNLAGNYDLYNRGEKAGVFSAEAKARGHQRTDEQMADAAHKKAFSIVVDPTQNRSPDALATAESFIANAPAAEPWKQAQLANLRATHGVSLEKDDVERQSIQDPLQAQVDLDNPEKYKLISPGDREVLKQRAKAYQAQFAQEAFEQSKQSIDLNQAAEGETFDSEPFKQLTPFMRAQLRQYQLAKQQKAGMNDPETYQRTFTAIKGYDATKDASGMHKAEIGAAIDANFAGAHAAELKARLEEQAKPDKAGSVPLGDVFETLDKWAFKDKRFGEYEKPKLGPDGKQVVKEVDVKTLDQKGPGWLGARYWLPGTDKVGTEFVKDNGKQVVKELEPDPVKRDAITGKVQGIKQQIESEVKSGLIKDRPALFKRLGELTQLDTLARDAEGVESSNEPQTSLIPALTPNEIEELKKKYSKP